MRSSTRQVFDLPGRFCLTYRASWEWRVTTALFQMKKLELATLEAAWWQLQPTVSLEAAK